MICCAAPETPTPRFAQFSFAPVSSGPGARTEVRCSARKRRSEPARPRTGSGWSRTSCLRGALDLRAVVLPKGRVAPVPGGAPRLRSHRAVELLAQDVGVSGVTIGLVEDVDQDVEELHVRAWPP